MLAPLAHPEVVLTERRQQFARLVAGIVGVAIVHAAGAARAQGFVNDQSAVITVNGDNKGSLPSWLHRFDGSWANLSTYIGSGSFYTSGYRDPYVSNVFFAKPSFMLGTKYDLSLVGRVVFEYEYTKPDNPQARHFYAEDTWLSLAAKNLYTGPRSKIKVSGSTRVVLPTSWESQYSHLVAAWGVGLGASRPFEFGRPDAQGKRWHLVVGLSTGAAKLFQTSEVRGNYPGDVTGCRLTGPAVPIGGVGAAGDDRCGGPLNTNFTLLSSGFVEISRGKWNLNVSLTVINNFKYQVDPTIWMNSLSTLGTIPAGRDDKSWGIIQVSRELTSHFALTALLNSYQPAMSADFKTLRFPFFDFAGPNANNYTQISFGVTGTL